MPTSIMELLENYRLAAEKLRAYLAGKVTLIPDNPGIKRIGSGCFTVKLSTIAESPNLMLDPYYYDFEFQKNAILSILNSKASFEHQINALKEIAETGKRRVDGYTIKFHSDVRNKIAEILSEL